MFRGYGVQGRRRVKLPRADPAVCVQRDRYVRHLISMMVTLSIFAICLLGTGCRDVSTTWLAEAWSPDGSWAAIARSHQWGGSGTAYHATTVYLKSVKTSQLPTQVLVFSHQYATMNLKMAWSTPTHLEVIYGPSANPGDHVSLDFQVPNFQGVEISVRNLSSPPSR